MYMYLLLGTISSKSAAGWLGWLGECRFIVKCRELCRWGGMAGWLGWLGCFCHCLRVASYWPGAGFWLARAGLAPLLHLA